jgi:16S rRNA (cytosine1402-N4)-methyltransferase
MSLHVSVLPQEVMHYLDPQEGQFVVDATVGAGGHARLLAEKVGPRGKVIGLDQDPEMLSLARQALEGSEVSLVQGSFEDLPEILQKLQIQAVNGIVADLGGAIDVAFIALHGTGVPQNVVETALASGDGAS